MQKLFSIELHWYGKSLLTWLLWPISKVVCGLTRWRFLRFRAGKMNSDECPVPLIVVGNITVGGTGKTPMITHLAQLLTGQGYRVGLVSRGYGGKAAEVPQEVFASSYPIEVGDEPVMLARRLGLPMFVHPNRPMAIKALLDKYTLDVVLSDDGMQHYAMGRDIEIAMIDSTRLMGNGFCLPAGPLREFPERLDTVDFVVYKGPPPADTQFEGYIMKLQPADLVNVRDPKVLYPYHQLRDKPVTAVAGIGHPNQFFKLLKKLGAKLTIKSYPDHYSFVEQDFPRYGLIVMTEKDAVKCQGFDRSNLWYLPVDAQLEKAFDEAFMSKFKAVSQAKRFKKMETES
jgi:tetraacyldisaccharide 4'-kinase